MTIALETAHDRMFEDLTRFVRGELSFRSNEMERRFLRELAWVWTEFRDTEDGKSMRAKFATEYWSEKALKKIYKISSGCEGDIDLNSSAVKGSLSDGILSASSLVENEFRHEHVVPKKMFIDTVLKLREQGSVDESFKYKLLQNFVGCIITKEESGELDKQHRNYPDKGKLLDDEDFDCWIRYREYNRENPDKQIVVYKCRVKKGMKAGRRWGLEVLGRQSLGGLLSE